MTLKEMHALIREIVTEKPGIKGTELITDVLTEMYLKGQGYAEHFAPDLEPVDAINTLVKQGDIVEIEYCVPVMSYRIKSLYFPKGTEIKRVK